MTSERAIPIVPLALGLGGLVPFVALALLAVTGSASRIGIPADAARAALLAYGAVIASFLGGIRWGAALREPDGGLIATDYLFGVTPQLFGWGALFLPDPWRFALLGLGLLVLGPIDRNLVARGLAPVWFGRLRTVLSLGAGAALFVTALT